MNQLSAYDTSDDHNDCNIFVDEPCECCPYGFHIDTDFVRYCDALLMALYNENGGNDRSPDNHHHFRSYGSIERKFRFKFDKYLEHNSMILGKDANEDFDPKYLDFSTVSVDPSSSVNGKSSSNVIKPELTTNLAQNDRLSVKIHHETNNVKHQEQDGESPPLSPTSSSGLSSTVSKSVLTQIRNHLALSLFRVRELESQVSQVSTLKNKILKLEQERSSLLEQLNSLSLKEDKVEKQSNHHNQEAPNSPPADRQTESELNIEKFNSLIMDPVEKTVRSIGTLTSFAPCLLYRNVFIQTDLKSKDVKIVQDTNDFATMTDQECSEQVDTSSGEQSERFLENGSQTESVKIQYQEENPAISLKSTCRCSTVVDEQKTLSDNREHTNSPNLMMMNISNKSNMNFTTPTSSTQSIRLCEKCNNEMIVANHFDYVCSPRIPSISLQSKITKTDSGISVERRQSDTKIMEYGDNLMMVYPFNDFENIPLSDESDGSSKDGCKGGCLLSKQQFFMINNEIKAALKLINENLFTDKKSFLYAKSVAVVKKNWFKVSSSVDSDFRSVESYLDFVEKYSTKLLDFVVNLSDTNGNTAIHYAISYNNFDIVSVLLDSKICDINRYNKAGYTAAMLVSLAKIENELYRDIVERLFNQADVNLKAKQNGQTALMLAASHGRVEISKILLDCGAEVNLQDNDGSTALMCAAEHGHSEVISLLLSHPDCDPLIEDHEASTALKIALVNGHNDIGVLLYAGSRNSCLINLFNRTPNCHRRTGSFTYSSSLYQVPNSGHYRKSPPRLRRSSLSSPSPSKN